MGEKEDKATKRGRPAGKGGKSPQKVSRNLPPAPVSTYFRCSDPLCPGHLRAPFKPVGCPRCKKEMIAVPEDEVPLRKNQKRDK